MYNPNIYISVKPNLFAFINVFMVNFISFAFLINTNIPVNKHC